MFVRRKLILEAYLACCNGSAKKFFENILILQKHNRDKNKLLSITTQTQLKQKIVFTSRATSFMSNRKSLHVTSVNCRGYGFRKGTIFGTLPLLIKTRKKNINVKKEGMLFDCGRCFTLISRWKARCFAVKQNWLEL